MEFITKDVDETIKLGYSLGEKINPGDIICLDGELGTGKTHFVKGIASALGIKEYITSPTFTIVNQYEGRIKLNHFDVYRVSDPDEISAIGFDEYIFSDAASVIEWSKFIEELIPDEHVNILIEKINTDENSRKITINYSGKRYDYIKELHI